MLVQRPEGIYWAFGLGSVAVHAAAVVFLFLGGSLRRDQVSAQPVELVSLPSGVLDPLAPILPDPVPEAPATQEEPAKPPEPEAPPPPPKPEPDQMREPNQVKTVKKPTPRPSARATPRPTTRAAEPAPIGTPAPPREQKFAMRQRRGVPTGFDVSGAMSFDNESFSFAYYGTSLQTKLSNNFYPPPNAFVPGRTFETTIFFVIGKNGELLEHRIEKPSGFPQLDEAAERAVLVSQPYPPLPVGFRGTELGVTMRFRCGQ
jgi:protein TonB